MPEVLDILIKELPEIKCCPFCGNDGVLEFIKSDYSFKRDVLHITNKYKVGCKNCNMFTVAEDSDIYQDKNGKIYVIRDGARIAIKKWNERFAPDCVFSGSIIDKEEYFTNRNIEKDGN